MTSIIRYKRLPENVHVLVWTEGDDTVIVVNSALDTARQKSAVRAALRSRRGHRRSKVLLPLPILLAYQIGKEWLHVNPAAAVSGTAAVSVAATAVAFLNFTGPPPATPFANEARSVPSATAPATTHSASFTTTTRPPRRPSPKDSVPLIASAEPVNGPASAGFPPRVPVTTAPAPPQGSTPKPPSTSPSPTSRRPRPSSEPSSSRSPIAPDSPRPTSEPTRERPPDKPKPKPNPNPKPDPKPKPDPNPKPNPKPKPTGPAKDCDGVHVSVDLDPVADVDACLLG